MTPGTRLGPYEILDAIGAGGMGEVFKARDTRLDRIVAIKTSKDQFTERFDREARAVAALNHPNICHLYDVGPNYLVMEYVEGPTLADRIRATSIPIPEALAIARQIAEGLEAAHEKGIVHRDLKPANVKITPEGKVKVLDFGLAKAFETSAASSSSGDPTNSPTLTLASTRAGVILGTAAYMSPEQARGVPADKRADIWSFGVVLFEMLTGRDTFTGPTVSDTLAAVLRADLQWNSLPAETPAAVRRLLRRCLERDRALRLHDIADARLELDEPPESTAAAAKPTPLPWIAAALLLAAGAALAFVHFREQPKPEPVFHSSLVPPEKGTFTALQAQSGGIALSPDGATLAFVATQDGKTLLWVRRLDSISGRPLPGTENAYLPFWSPDNRFLAFFADGKLKKIEVSGGPPQVICDSGDGRGGAWAGDGTIVFTGTGRMLQRVPAAGGQPVAISALDKKQAETAHYWPEFLPDGRHFLFLVRAREGTAIRVGSVDDKPGVGKPLELAKSAAQARYVPAPDGRGGWLLFLRESTLFAQRFDPDKLALQGDAVPVAERIGVVGNIVLANYTVSATGVLVYGHETGRFGRLAWMDRDGKQSAPVTDPGTYISPRLSPDGSRLAVTQVESRTGNLDIWQLDIAHGVTTRFTFDPAADSSPVWSPDGSQILFQSMRDGTSQLYVKPSGGAGSEERIAALGDATKVPTDWSRDGRYLLYTEFGSSSGADLWILPMTGERKRIPFLQTSFNEAQGQFSPDGRWIAYVSNESSRDEIYVRSFQGTPAKFQVSTNGGVEPRWRGDGRELYYIDLNNRMMAVGVKAAGAGFERETPRPLFDGHSRSGNVVYSYDVTRDGRRFIAVSLIEGEGMQPLTLVTNWLAGLKQ